jgi:hypothetical protein
MDKNKSVGAKCDGDKADWSLLPIEPVEEVVQVLMFGAKKYAPDDWKHVENGEVRYFNAAMRHILAWKKGENTDPETGINHLAHATCCLLFLQWKDAQNGKHNDKQ